MSEKPVFIYLAGYNSTADARADFKVLKDLKAEGSIEGFDAALVFKGEDGKVHVRKREKGTPRAVWTGLGIGAVLGVVLPPSIPVSAAMNGTARGLMTYFRRGMSRADIKDLGEALEEGEAALIILSESPLEETLDVELARADRSLERRVQDAAETLKHELEAAR